MGHAIGSRVCRATDEAVQIIPGPGFGGHSRLGGEISIAPGTALPCILYARGCSTYGLVGALPAPEVASMCVCELELGWVV
jgi:hypothetical protein